MHKMMDGYPYIPESYSRSIDNIVKTMEMPYGYLTQPPSADSGDYNIDRLESKKKYSRRDMRGRDG